MPEAHDELSELREHAEQAKETGLARVSLTMAFLAVLVAVVTLLGHRAHTEEVILQTKASNQWAYYDQKSTLRRNYEFALDQLDTQERSGEKPAGKRQKYEAALEHEGERQKEIQAEARKLEEEFGTERRRANRFDLAEGLLEAALVITSITLLTRRRGFWVFGSALAMVGIVVAVTAFAVH